MSGRIAALYRHPVKGFTPQRLDAAVLETGGHFPCDRMWCVENGPSGFDPEAPRHISKMRFTVLARIPELARARTAYDEATGRLQVRADGFAPFDGDLTAAQGRTAFEGWLGAFLDAAAPDADFGPLKVLRAPAGHRFMDSRKGFVSVLNLASVRELEQRLGRPVDPARFRANVQVEGWDAWSEYGLEPGRPLRLGGAELTLLADTDRCLATHVDPDSGDKDIDMVPALYANYGHICCGVYLSVARGGLLAVGDVAEWIDE